MSPFNKKRLLLVGAGQEQIAAIQAAHDLDLFVIAVDGNPRAPGLLLADQGICGDIRNIEYLIQLGKTEHIHGVFSHAVDLPHVVGAVAQQLHLPGLDPEIAVRATNKWRRYQCLESHGVPCPKFGLVHSVDEAHGVILNSLANFNAKATSIIFKEPFSLPSNPRIPSRIRIHFDGSLISLLSWLRASP